MSDIRFNQWLHQSGTGGVSQSDGGHVGIGTTNPLLPVGAGNTNILHVGVVTSNSISAGSSITATTFYGSGANLTSLPSQLTLSSNADNRIITGGSGVNLNAESTLTYDASLLNITSTTQGLGLRLRNTGNEYTSVRFDAARTGASSALGILEGRWNNSQNVCAIYLQTGDDTTNKDDGRISMLVQSASGANKIALKIEPDASVQLPNDSQKLQLGNDQDLNIWHGGSNGYIDNETGALVFRTTGSNTERLRIASDGEILVPAAGANRISMRHTSGGNAVIKNPTAANLSFGTNNQDNELTIKNGGNVGINETSPDAPLHITGGLPHIRLENSGTSASAGDTFGQIDFKHNDSDDAGVTAAIKCVAEDNAGNSYLSFCNGDGGNANERLRIDSTGRVLIGGTSHPSGESIRTLNLISTSSTEAALVLSRSNSLGGSTTGQTIRLLTNGDLNFSVHNVGEKVRFPAAGGITFNGDSAAANALDDYEEGRYAPTPTGQTGTTSASFYGGDHYLSYTKIGNLVTIHGRIRLQNSNYNGGLRISLPFTADTSSDTDNSGGSSVGTHTVNFDNDAVGTGHNMGLLLETGSGSALGYFLINRDNSSWIAATAGNIKSGSYMLISHTYKST